MHSVKSTSTINPANSMLFVIVLASLVAIGFGSVPTVICPKEPIYVPLYKPTTVFVSAFGNSSLLFATSSLPIFASNFSAKTGPIYTGSVLPPTVNVSVTLTPIVAANGSITVSFTDLLTGSASCTIYYIGYTGPTCTVVQTTLFVSVGEVFTATVIGFSPNSKLTAKASNLPANTTGSIIANTTLISSVVVITAVPGIPAFNLINVQFFDQYGFNTTCSVSYTVTVGSTTSAPTSPAPSKAPTPEPTTEETSYTDYYPSYTTSPPTQAATTQPPKPTTPNTPFCNAPSSPVYLPIGQPTTIKVAVYGKHPLVLTTINLPSFAQLMNGLSAITSGVSLSASANVSVVLRPLLALNASGTFSLVFTDLTDGLNSFTTCAIRYVSYSGPTCISAGARVVAHIDRSESSAYVGAIVGFSPISTLTVRTQNLPIGINITVNNTLAPVTYAAVVSRTSALNSSVIVNATFFDTYGFNATCLLRITAVANASLLPFPTHKPTNAVTSSPTTVSVTTNAPSTSSPTTASGTTVVVTNSAPTTVAPSTRSVVTAPATTAAITQSQTTVPATTSAATTSTPTTSMPANPTSVKPTSANPTSAPTVVVTVQPTQAVTVQPTQAATVQPTQTVTTAAPVSTTSVPTSVVTDQATTSMPSVPTTSAAVTTSQPATDVVVTIPVVTLPVKTISVTIPTETIRVTLPLVTLPPVVIPQSVCPAAIHLIAGVNATVSVQVKAQGFVSLQVQNIPSFAVLSNSRGLISIGSAFNADENVTITFKPTVSVSGSFALTFIDQLSLLNTSCNIAYDVYAGPSCTVNQPSGSIVVGNTFSATVNGVSSDSALSVSASASANFRLSTQNNLVTVSASPSIATNESIAITFTDKYGFNATCSVNLRSIEDVIARFSVAMLVRPDILLVLLSILMIVML